MGRMRCVDVSATCPPPPVARGNPSCPAGKADHVHILRYDRAGRTYSSTSLYNICAIEYKIPAVIPLPYSLCFATNCRIPLTQSSGFSSATQCPLPATS